MTSADSQLFASLDEYDIFYRWHRIHSGDIMTNQKRKTKSVDKQAPTGINRESDNNTLVRHFIILKPCSGSFKDTQTSLRNMAGRKYLVLKLIHKVLCVKLAS